MTLRNVLSHLESTETNFINKSDQYGQDALRLDEAEQKRKLESLSTFSTKLSDYLVSEKKKENKRLYDEGYVSGRIGEIEEDIEKEEEEKGSSVSPEEREEYDQGVEQLKKNKTAFDTAALNIQEEGGSFQEADKVKNMSGSKLYGYTVGKAVSAGENYKPWMEGEMATNDDIKITFQGEEFTPKTAKTLDQKRVAMTALRRKYLQEQGLLGVHKVLLADHFYETALPAHSQIMANFQKEDAIEKSFVDEEQAVRDFQANKDFGSLVSSLAPLWDKNGKKYGRRGALDKAIEIVKGQMDIGELDDDALKAIRAQTTTIKINGKDKEVVVGKYWKTRFDQLEEDLIKEQTENIQSDLDAQEIAGKEIKRDFRNWVKERRKNKEDITEAHLEKWAEIYEVATGESAPTFITDYQSKEDRDDEEDIKRLKKLRKSKRYLVESDLDDVSEDVYERMIGFVREDKPIADAPGSFDSEAKQKIRGWTNVVIENIDGSKDDTPAYNEGYWNAYRDYNRLFADYVRKGEPIDKAQKFALEDVEKNFALDKGSDAKLNSKYWTIKKLVPEGKRVPSQVVQDIAVGIREIDKYSTKKEALDGLSTTVIEGSQPYLIEGLKYKEGKRDTIPHYYRRLAESFEDLSDWDILDAQLKANGVKEGLGKRPEVLDVLDDPLLEDLKRKLNKLTTKNQIEQAKYDVDDMESYTSGLFAYSIFNTDENLLTPGLYETVV